MRRLPLILLVLAFILGSNNLVDTFARSYSQNSYPGISFRFEKISIDDGLSQNAGLALLQDSQGYLWIGTQDGLNRYSGLDLSQFKHNPDDSNSISHNSIIALFEDKEGMLWDWYLGRRGEIAWIPEQIGLTALWPTRRTRMRCQTRPLRRFLKTKTDDCGLVHKMAWQCLIGRIKNLFFFKILIGRPQYPEQ